MRKVLAAALMVSAASFAGFAIAQDKKPDQFDQPAMTQIVPQGPVRASDARSLASDQEVGEARRLYRASCDRHESAAFCECVTAGVAQALMPAEVRMAARTIGERITAQGDAGVASDSDNVVGAESSLTRIEQVESHYADACASYRS